MPGLDRRWCHSLLHHAVWLDLLGSGPVRFRRRWITGRLRSFRFQDRVAGIGAGRSGARRRGGRGSARLAEAAGIRDGSNITARRRVRRSSHKSFGVLEVHSQGSGREEGGLFHNKMSMRMTRGPVALAFHTYYGNRPRRFPRIKKERRSTTSSFRFDEPRGLVISISANAPTVSALHPRPRFQVEDTYV